MIYYDKRSVNPTDIAWAYGVPAQRVRKMIKTVEDELKTRQLRADYYELRDPYVVNGLSHLVFTARVGFRKYSAGICYPTRGK